MLDAIEALAALSDARTMTRAANRLRITQSAISKRIASLTDQVGVPLIERDGRRVRLTAAGRQLLARARPLIAELRAAVADPAAETGGRIHVGVSESVLASWGPALLARVHAKLPDVELVLSAHRSLVAIERVRAGEYHLALCAGAVAGVADLSQIPLALEAMVLIGAGDRRIRKVRRRHQVITIEPGSASWQSIRPQIRRLREAGVELEIERTVQSFTSVVQLARAGFATGLAPAGAARALGAVVTRLPEPGMTRPIALYARAATLGRSGVASWVEALREAFRLPGQAASFLMPA